jgi:hypothetical protein
MLAVPPAIRARSFMTIKLPRKGGSAGSLGQDLAENPDSAAQDETGPPANPPPKPGLKTGFGGS